ncbi:MAG: molybdopterin molybdotransferase MoeA [Rhodocyclaceae bacterium]|nr:molybdopterin molybdotransferase MoeA [Rhodocyclaceae bacterium]
MSVDVKTAPQNKPLMELDQALSLLLAGARPITERETVSTFDAVGRVLAQTQYSSINVPPLDNSSMDGYAVRCADVPAVGTTLTVSQRIPAGSVGAPLAAGTAARIFTGAPVPPGADAIVMQEYVSLSDANGAFGQATFNELPKPGEWIRRAGEDIRTGGEVLAQGTRLRPQEAGLAASVGLAELPVFRRPRVALFSTGDELVMPGEPLPEGAIYNSNRFLLKGLLEQLGCVVIDFGIIPDRLDATRAALRKATAEDKADLILTSGGVSMGEEDHIKPAVEAEGALDHWLVNSKPGRPFAFGRVMTAGHEAAFIGLPGNPVSSFVTFLLLVRPFIRKLQGMHVDLDNALPQGLTLVAGFDQAKADRRREFLRARIGKDGLLELFPNQSSGVLTSAAWADGLIDNPAGVQIKRGDTVRFLPFSELLT